MPKRRYDSAFVPARQSLWQSILHWLFPPRAKVRRKAAQDAPEFWNQVTPAVWELRRRGTEAQQLLHRYINGESTSRRECARSGLSESAWRRARRVLLSAKIIDRKGNLLYGKRDAQLRLDVFLKEKERQLRENLRYIPPI